MSAKVLILDEPTASLDAHEVQMLFEVMRSLKAHGIGILLITHFLDQVYQISDRITVLRNGEKVGEYKAASLPRRQLVSLMLGRELDQRSCEEDSASGRSTEKNAEAFLQVQGLGRKGMLEPLDLSVAKGEIVGLAGSVGIGTEPETARLIFGIDRSDEGEVHVKGRKVTDPFTPSRRSAMDLRCALKTVRSKASSPI